MKTVTITYPDGKKIIKEISDKKAKLIEDFFKKARNRKEKLHEEMAVRLAKVPPIHFEILKYHNNHTKEDTIAEYPEHREFIDTIR
jgi:hypothetical protein